MSIELVPNEEGPQQSTRGRSRLKPHLQEGGVARVWEDQALSLGDQALQAC